MHSDVLIYFYKGIDTFELITENSLVLVRQHYTLFSELSLSIYYEVSELKLDIYNGIGKFQPCHAINYYY